MPTSTFAEELIAWRAKHVVTQVKAAELFGVSPASVSKWERGRSEPRGEILAAVKAAMQAPPKPTVPSEGWIEAEIDIPPGASFHVKPPMGGRPGLVTFRYPSGVDPDERE